MIQPLCRLRLRSPSACRQSSLDVLQRSLVRGVAAIPSADDVRDPTRGGPHFQPLGRNRGLEFEPVMLAKRSATTFRGSHLEDAEARQRNLCAAGSRCPTIFPDRLMRICATSVAPSMTARVTAQISPLAICTAS